MCKYSLEGYSTRKAVVGETLVANEHKARGHGCLTQPNTPSNGTLTCVRDGTTLTIDKLEFVRKGAAEFLHAWGFSREALDYIGQRVVVKLRDGRGQAHGIDYMTIVGTHVHFPLVLLKHGLEVYVGEKIVPKTLDEKLGLDAKSLRAIAADDPKDKDDEEKKEKKEEEEKPEPQRTLGDTYEPANPMVMEPPRVYRTVAARRWRPFWSA